MGGKARTGAGRRRAGRAARAGALPGACAHRPAPAGPRPAPGWPTCRPGARGPPPSPGERLPGAAAAAVLAVIRPTPPGAAGRSRTAVLVIMPSLLVPLGRSAPSRTRTSRSGGMTWRVGAGRVRRPSMTRRDASAAPRSCWSSRGRIDPHVPPSRHAPPGARLFLCAGGPKPAQRGPLPVPQRRKGWESRSHLPVGAGGPCPARRAPDAPRSSSCDRGRPRSATDRFTRWVIGEVGCPRACWSAARVGRASQVRGNLGFRLGPLGRQHESMTEP